MQLRDQDQPAYGRGRTQTRPGASIVGVLLITAAFFGALSLWAYATTRSLPGMGPLLSMGVIGLLLAMIVSTSPVSSTLQLTVLVISALITGWRRSRTRNSMQRVGTCAACILVLVPLGAQAGLREDKDEIASSPEIELSTGALLPLTQIALKKQPSKAARSKATSSSEASKARAPAKPEDGKGTASSREQRATESEKAVVGEAESGVEYFCHQPRKRLWVQDRGWIVRRVTYCF